jgi:hypothetical protein
VVKSVTVPGKCYAISDSDRQDDPKKIFCVAINVLGNESVYIFGRW